MGNFATLTQADNLAATSSVSASGSAIAFPAANAIVLPISMPWRSLAASTSEYLEFDLGTAKFFNFVIIVNHNFTSNAVVTLTTGSSPSPAGNVTAIGYRKQDMFAGTPSQTFRYARLNVNDAGNPDGFLQVGLVMLGVIVIPGYNFSYGYERERRFVDAENLTEFGVDHVAGLYDETGLRLEFRNLRTYHMDELEALFEKLQGKRGKFFLAPDSDKYEGFFGRFTNSFVRRHDFYHTVELLFRSDSRGKAMGA